MLKDLFFVQSNVVTSHIGSWHFTPLNTTLNTTNCYWLLYMSNRHNLRSSLANKCCYKVQTKDQTSNHFFYQNKHHFTLKYQKFIKKQSQGQNQSYQSNIITLTDHLIMNTFTPPHLCNYLKHQECGSSTMFTIMIHGSRTTVMFTSNIRTEWGKSELCDFNCGMTFDSTQTSLRISETAELLGFSHTTVRETQATTTQDHIRFHSSQPACNLEFEASVGTNSPKLGS